MTEKILVKLPNGNIITASEIIKRSKHMDKEMNKIVDNAMEGFWDNIFKKIIND